MRHLLNKSTTAEYINVDYTEGALRLTPTLTIVTTSWDDGHPLDFRLAELLSSYGVLGTFYVPLSHRRIPPVTPHRLQSLRQLGMEIGAHGIDHTVFTRANNLSTELVTGKKLLENLVGEPISSLAYPKGAFNSNVCRLVADSGYRLARTTAAFRTSLAFDPFRMPVSLHFSRHSNKVLIRHALKDGNLRGLIDWWRRWQCETDPFLLAELMFEDVCNRGGVFHLWGHSWEIDTLGLWDAMERLLKRIAARPGVRYLTNRQTIDAIER
jgi:hypothetical protein